MNHKQSISLTLVLFFGLVMLMSMLIGAGQTQVQPVAAQQNDACAIDLMLVLDGSGSIDYSAFNTVKSFVNQLVASFVIGPNDAQIGVVQFSGYPQVEIGLSANASDITNAVDRMYKLDQNTDITSGIRLGQEQLDQGRTDAPKVMIVLTDGLHNFGPSPEPLAEQIRETRSTTILGVAVGGFDLTELISIAGADYNVVQVPTFDSLTQILSILYDYSCAVVTTYNPHAGSENVPVGTGTPAFIAPTPTLQSGFVVTATPAGPSSQPATAVANAPRPDSPRPDNQPRPPLVPAVSPLSANTIIAFASDRDGDSEIFVMNGDGTDEHQLTINQADDDKPDFSPDGQHIAFESSTDGDFDIWIMRADGSDLINLTNNKAQDYGPSWSPDGGQIAYHSTADGNIEIWVMNADGSNQHQITNNALATSRSPVWSPDGQNLLYFSDESGGRELYRVELATGAVYRLTENEFYDGQPDWAASTGRLLFSSTRVDENANIFSMNLDGSDVQQLTTVASTDDDPAWSPDGSMVVFESNRTGDYDIWIAFADGTVPQQLTNSAGRDWSPDWAWRN
ncbi:MAG: PD40 domain-containing protein [Chloroflexi bacterium]|nr:PD40 domain-containing protein [Chloroflexota bacterium]